jgi:hypothetical protein
MSYLLSLDLVNYGTDIVLRKLVISSISLVIEQKPRNRLSCCYGGALLLYAEKRIKILILGYWNSLMDFIERYEEAVRVKTIIYGYSLLSISI